MNPASDGAPVIRVGRQSKIPVTVTPAFLAAVARATLAGEAPEPECVVTVDCPQPFCYAPAGKPCVTQRGYARRVPHSRRAYRFTEALRVILGT